MRQISAMIALLLSIVAALVAPIAAKNIEKPFYRDGMLAYCLTSSTGHASGDGCGEPAATAYCIFLGYDRALGFTGPTPVPVGKKTVSFPSREGCVSSAGKTCFTFDSINCIREKKFIRPKVDGKLLDWCLDGVYGCGKPAADAFCVSQGFSHSAWTLGGPDMRIDEDTVQPKTNRICDSKRQECQGFGIVTCEK